MWGNLSIVETNLCVLINQTQRRKKKHAHTPRETVPSEGVCVCNLNRARDQQVQHTSPSCITQIRHQLLKEDLTWLQVELQKVVMLQVEEERTKTPEGHELGVKIYLSAVEHSMLFQTVPYIITYRFSRLTTLAYPLLQNFCVSVWHLFAENLSRAQKHGFHSRTLQQSDLILAIQREKTCRMHNTTNYIQPRTTSYFVFCVCICTDIIVSVWCHNLTHIWTCKDQQFIGFMPWPLSFMYFNSSFKSILILYNNNLTLSWWLLAV